MVAAVTEAERSGACACSYKMLQAIAGLHSLKPGQADRPWPKSSSTFEPSHKSSCQGCHALGRFLGMWIAGQGGRNHEPLRNNCLF